MLAFRQISALSIVTIAKWIEPIYGRHSERAAKGMFFLLLSFNALVLILLLSPGTLVSLVTIENRGWNLLIVLVIWMVAQALLFGRRSIPQLAAEAQLRWPSTVGRESMLVGMYCAGTAVFFWGIVVMFSMRH